MRGCRSAEIMCQNFWIDALTSDTNMTKFVKLKLQGKRDKQIVISIDNTLDEKLTELAEVTDMSVSTIGYQILKQAIEHVEA